MSILPKKSSVSVAIKDHFSELTDPRRRPPIYPLINVVTIALCAVVCGADDFVAIAKWGRTKREWLAKFLDMSSGIPSHDRFNAIFAMIKPAEFEKCLLSWITSLHEISDGQLVAIDGKTLRGSFDAASSKAAIHMVSAWATTNLISLGQVIVDDKSNEITAIPKLLKMLELSGCLVTIDAMGCQTAIARGDPRPRRPTTCFAVKDKPADAAQRAIEEFFDRVGWRTTSKNSRSKSVGRCETKEYGLTAGSSTRMPATCATRRLDLARPWALGQGPDGDRHRRSAITTRDGKQIRRRALRHPQQAALGAKEFADAVRSPLAASRIRCTGNST